MQRAQGLDHNNGFKSLVWFRKLFNSPRSRIGNIFEFILKLLLPHNHGQLYRVTGALLFLLSIRTTIANPRNP
eukprot:2794085-Amphidinium_carterae.1